MDPSDEHVVPWDEMGGLEFCASETFVSILAEWFREGHGSARSSAAQWASSDDPQEPLAFALRIAFGKSGSTRDEVLAIFQSLCDQHQAAVDQKCAIAHSWASALAGVGPTSDPQYDLPLWSAAWSHLAEPQATQTTDNRRWNEMRPGQLVRSLECVCDRSETGVPECDEFLGFLEHGREAGEEAVVFAMSLLDTRLAARTRLGRLYGSIFAAVVELLYWPRMAEHADVYLRAATLEAWCERRTSYATSQNASLTQAVSPSCFA